MAQVSFLVGGEVPYDKDESRAALRSRGLRFKEVDIQFGSPKELHRKLVRVVQDAGFQIKVDQVNVQSSTASSIGDVLGMIVGCRDASVPSSLKSSSHPHKSLGIFLVGVGGLFVLGALAIIGDDSFSCMAIAGLLMLLSGLLLMKNEKSATIDLFTRTVVRLRMEGEAYETKTEEESSAGKKVGRSLVTSKLTVSMNVEYLLGCKKEDSAQSFDPAVLARDASRYLDEGARVEIEKGKSRAVDEVDELCGRVSKFSEAA